MVKEAQGAVQAAGMKPGDRITALNGTPVWTFGDVQYRYDKVDRHATEDADLRGPRRHRPSILTSRCRRAGGGPTCASASRAWSRGLDFEDRPLTDAEKQKLGLKPDGFASQVKYVAEFAKIR